MLINFVGNYAPTSRSLTLDQSRSLLQFCRAIGATIFTVNFVFVKGEKSENLMEEFYQRISPFAYGERVLEALYGNGFKRQACWVLDEQSTEVILRETAGDLFAYDVAHLPEDWLFYLDDSIVLQIVTHEQEATLRVSAPQYEEFKGLGIPHQLGCAQWTGLPEEPLRSGSPRNC